MKNLVEQQYLEMSLSLEEQIVGPEKTIDELKNNQVELILDRFAKTENTRVLGATIVGALGLCLILFIGLQPVFLGTATFGYLNLIGMVLTIFGYGIGHLSARSLAIRKAEFHSVKEISSRLRFKAYKQKKQMIGFTVLGLVFLFFGIDLFYNGGVTYTLQIGLVMFCMIALIILLSSWKINKLIKPVLGSLEEIAD